MLARTRSHWRLRTWKSAAVPVVMAVATAGSPHGALAYRPFDSTDAAIAAPGEFEIELGPAGYLKDGSGRILVAPAAILNLGIADNWEVVVEGRGHTTLHPVSTQTRLVDDQISLKGILREGSLQNKSGPSVAAEFAVLLPEVNGTHGAGAAAAAIMSQRWPWGSLHFNAEATLTRDQTAEIFIGGIAEGPSDWKVRPVAEVLYEREIGRSEKISGLIGAIWQLKDNLAIDLGIRHANTATQTENEVRLGLTLSFALRKTRRP